MTRTPTSKGRSVRGPGLLLAAALLAAGPVAAQDAAPLHIERSFDVNLFNYATSPNSFLTIDTAEVPAAKQFGLALVLGYQRSPFSLYTVQDNSLSNPTEVVRNQFGAELVGAVGIADRFQVGLGVPITLALDGDRFDMMGRHVADRSGRGFGDIRVEGKVRLGAVGPDEEIVFALAPGLTVPTGNQNNFMGDKTLTGRLRALAELRRGDLRIGGMLGLLLRQESEIFAATVGSQLLYGGAASFAFNGQVGAVAEVVGRSGLKDFGERWVDANPVEADLGVRLNVTNVIALTVGGGTGFIKGIGAPKARGFLAASWAPDFRDKDRDGVYDIDDKCPDQVEDRDGYRDDDGCPDPDNDGDGLADAADRCPNDAEDLDQFEDEDGCPEPDNDKDGYPDINDPCPNAAEDKAGKKPNDGCPSTAEDQDGDSVPDVRDKCPDDVEDRDNFEDDDGCPDPDNDGDGIPDNFDGCPDGAEDADGFEDDDGCPDPDNDKDGFLDKDDKCPTKPETLNGNKDEDGCPDTGAPTVRLGTGKIEVDERIGFVAKAGKSEVKDSSLPTVFLVALVMRANPEITMLRVEVRAEGVAKEETQVRADAVKQALASKGVEVARITAVGMGGGGNQVDFVIQTMTAPKKKGAPAAAGEQTPPQP